MAADVSFLLRIMNNGGYKDDQKPPPPTDSFSSSSAPPPKSTLLITRDLLRDSSSPSESTELDLDLHVPSGWEKRLDLKSGKVYVQRCSSRNTSSLSSDHKHQSSETAGAKLQDLNFPPSPKQPLNLFDDTSLDLKLVSSSSSNYQSVCTLDKVKSALERAEKETIFRKRSVSVSMSKSSSPLSNSSSSLKEVETMDYEDGSSSSVAAGCPGCLFYVLISKNNPKCPRCNTVVPMTTGMKKPRIDLNISI
ncbi:uncharacterized protein LOC127791439 [Diospyros lotus]|uniref:uncharacterized protein LOC127791439 n=1 Tax=Diospyros lotus TaxID=55363 RepID=UPI0022538887|nr:uncharacterized protein LOC127791439 [Diospyros lotus]